MRRPPQVGLLADGRRLHLQDGPIDLIVEAFGAPAEIQAAYSAAARRFTGLLDELCAELPLLRAPAGPLEPTILPHAEVPAEGGPRSTHEGRPSAFWSRPSRLDAARLAPQDEGSGMRTAHAESVVPYGSAARRMCEAVLPFAAETFITPMAAVAGAVAEEVLSAMTVAARLVRAYANNGGDIALHLAPGQSFAVGLVDSPDRPGLFGSAIIGAADPVRGIATSGWRGRSFSLGIADAVTVLAASAAEADAAATIVANAVDLPGHPAIERRAACDIQPDSDLGARLVTRAVGPLGEDDIESALDSGAGCAERLVARGLIAAAALHLQGVTRVVGSHAPFDATLGISAWPATAAA
jgi:ApbE superfamily uncharacterized protein (UPF0280 family)